MPSVRPGDTVSDFHLPDENGKERSLFAFLEGGPVVLFFYPMALTPGCTAECSHFRDLSDEFGRLGAQRVGISHDPVDKQRKFVDKNGFDFPLLSDEDGVVASAFGVRRVIGLLPNKRWTFVIGADRRIVDVIKSETHMERHADLALKALESERA